MLTWTERKDHWRLRRQLRRLNRAHRPEPDLTKEELRSRAAEYSMERQLIDYPLWAIETAELRRWADRLSIDVKAEWDEDGLRAGYAFFSREDRNALQRVIRQERREAAKFWATLLVPVLSLLVALAAVLFR